MEAALTQIFTQTAAMTFVVMGVFMRVGAAMFLLPGFGERSVPVRFRLAMAFLLALLLAPLVLATAPAPPDNAARLVAILLAEVLAGLVIGLAFRLMIFALQIAGSIAAQNVSISHIFGIGVGVASSSEPTIASFLAFGGIAVALALGLHVDAVAALAGLYATLPFGVFVAGNEAAAWSVKRVAHVFAFGLSLALPFVAVGFAYNMALGALSRAMPQLLVALIGVPLLVGLGMTVLWASLPEIFARWTEMLGRVAAAPLEALP